jgi:MoaA/NifB/PqqE/SkfB family radical SAM enzyme
MTLTYNEREKIKAWLDTNNFCAMPFTHVAVESNGDIRPCCLGDPLKNPDGSTLSIIGKSIKEVIDHPTHVAFRQSFLDHQQHPACHPCWGVYHNDRFSGRHVYSSSAKVSDEVQRIINGKRPEQKLMWLEIKAGNRCNLACRICGLWNSAKWLKETYELKKSRSIEYPEFAKSPEMLYHTQSKWIDDVEFWQQIEGFDDIRIMHFMGGEPLMIDEHFEMLNAVADKFDASKIYIWYNTNGTIIPTAEQEEILSRFKEVLWSISIDDHGDKFNYQRKGADWQEVYPQLSYFYNKLNYNSTIDATISIYNIYTFADFIQELDKLGLADSLQPHYVTTGDGIHNVRTLHPDIKEKIKTKLLDDQAQLKPQHRFHIDDIIRFMMQIDAWTLEIDRRRKEEISNVDKFRNENFVKTFPEMAGLLGYE